MLLEEGRMVIGKTTMHKFVKMTGGLYVLGILDDL